MDMPTKRSRRSAPLSIRILKITVVTDSRHNAVSQVGGRTGYERRDWVENWTKLLPDVLAEIRDYAYSVKRGIAIQIATPIKSAANR